MPIRIPNNLPAKSILERENIFIMDENRAYSQDIRPLKIALINLMPTKINTETQLSRLLGNTPLQVELDLIQMSSHKSKNTSRKHLSSFYKTYDSIKNNYYDGMIITGAPIENLPFKEVTYWDELCELMRWSKKHVHSTLHICWGAQAGLFYHFGIEKVRLQNKLFGIYQHKVVYKNPILLRGFDEVFSVPHSRYTSVRTSDVKKCGKLKILASSKEAGIYAMATDKGKQIFLTGHSEYDRDTLKEEYLRDQKKGLNTAIPVNYFPNDDPTKTPIVSWRSHANLLFSNWLNYFVYQTTPFNLEEIGEDI